MKAAIDTFFASRTEHPLYYIEGGSRLWGIASPNSDFDIRGFHLPSKESYFDFQKNRDLIEKLDGDFDFVSFSMDKMFGLLAKSNPNVFEWVRSHIVYLNVLPDWERLQSDLVANYDLSKLFHHYLSMSKGQFQLLETERKFTYKTTFYVIRGLLSAEIARSRRIPALQIDKLFDQFEKGNDLIRIAKASLEKKKRQTENMEVHPTEKKNILTALGNFIAQMDKNRPERTNNPQRLQKILTDYNWALKTTIYG